MSALEKYREHWTDVVYRHGVLLTLQNNINNVDFNTWSYKEVIEVASNIEFMALTLRRMYEHIALAVRYIYPYGREETYQAGKRIKEIKEQIKKAGGEGNIELRVANISARQKQGITKQGQPSCLIPTDHVRKGEFLTLEDIEDGWGRLGNLLHVPAPTKNQPEYWEEKDILNKMISKIFALFAGHVLYENDIARVAGYWDGNKKVFSVFELDLLHPAPMPKDTRNVNSMYTVVDWDQETDSYSIEIDADNLEPWPDTGESLVYAKDFPSLPDTDIFNLDVSE